MSIKSGKGGEEKGNDRQKIPLNNQQWQVGKARFHIDFLS